MAYTKLGNFNTGNYVILFYERSKDFNEGREDNENYFTSFTKH